MPRWGTSMHGNAVYFGQDLPTAEGRQGSSVVSLRRNMIWDASRYHHLSLVSIGQARRRNSFIPGIRLAILFDEEQNCEEKQDAGCL
jgi:hypothetical protein